MPGQTTEPTEPIRFAFMSQRERESARADPAEADPLILPPSSALPGVEAGDAAAAPPDHLPPTQSAAPAAEDVADHGPDVAAPAAAEADPAGETSDTDTDPLRDGRPRAGRAVARAIPDDGGSADEPPASVAVPDGDVAAHRADDPAVALGEVRGPAAPDDDVDDMQPDAASILFERLTDRLDQFEFLLTVSGGGDAEALAERLDRIEASIAALAAPPASGSPDALETVLDRLDTLTSRFEDVVRSPVPASAMRVDTDSLAVFAAALAAAVRAFEAGADRIVDRLDALPGDTGRHPAPEAPGAVTDLPALSRLGDVIVALTTRLEALTDAIGRQADPRAADTARADLNPEGPDSGDRAPSDGVLSERDRLLLDVRHFIADLVADGRRQIRDGAA